MSDERSVRVLVRELVESSPPPPPFASNPSTLLPSTGSQRPRRRGIVVLVAAAALVVAVAVSIWGLASPGQEQGRRAAPGTSESAGNTGQGFSVTLPPGWTRANEVLQSTIKTEILAAASFPLVRDDSGPACDAQLPRRAVSDVSPTDAMVWLVETAPSDLDQPGAPANPSATEFPVRPARLSLDDFRQIDCSGPTWSFPNATFFWATFNDHGHVITAHLVLGTHASAQRTTEALSILDSLRFDSAEPACPAGQQRDTTDSSPPQCRVPPLGVTTTTSTPSTTALSDADAAGIRAAMLGWLNTQPRDAVGEFVEDFDAIRPSIQAGMAQHTSATLANYRGQLIDVRLVSATEATVRYNLLSAAQILYQDLSGTVDKTDGHWKVSRATVCALLSLGGITCPAP